MNVDFAPYSLREIDVTNVLALRGRRGFGAVSEGFPGRSTRSPSRAPIGMIAPA